MKIIWLEDEPETIMVIKNKILEHCMDITICQSFLKFSNELKNIKDCTNYLIILDIRIVFYVELEVTCFGKSFNINKELEAGLEYYLECLKNRFDDNKIIFLSSKTAKNTQDDVKKYNISPSQVIAKEDIGELIERIRNVKS